jgi:putative membrane protein
MGNGMMGGMCAGGMAIGLLLGLLLLVAVGFVAYRIGQSGGLGRAPGHQSSTKDDAIEVARTRYARGEISHEEFERLRRDLT